MKKFLMFVLTVFVLVAASACILDRNGTPIERTIYMPVKAAFSSFFNTGGENEESDWKLKLVNKWNPLEDDFEIETGTTKAGYLFDIRAVSALDEMLDAGTAEGLSFELTSAYRTREYQKGLYDNKVQRLMSEGYGYAEASALGATEVAIPGTSEHELGLAADIVCSYYPILDEGYADTAEAVWLRENCARFGFILRYPEGKSDATGIIFEPWHFRYVGVEAAEYIMENELCLEEYLMNQQ